MQWQGGPSQFLLNRPESKYMHFSETYRFIVMHFKGIRMCMQCGGECVIWQESIDEQPWEEVRSRCIFFSVSLPSCITLTIVDYSWLFFISNWFYKDLSENLFGGLIKMVFTT